MKNIVFDFGSVLVDWNPHRLYDGWFGSREKADWFLENVCKMEWNVQMDGGKPFAQGIAELSEEFPEWTEEIRMYFDRWIEMMGGEIPGMRELLLDLRAAGYHIYGLSNWSSETFCQVRGKYGIFDLLEGMVVSGEEHVTKPSAQIYRLFLDRFSLKAEECLFVDDNAANVEGALALGMRAVRFENETRLREYLRREGYLF